MSEVIMFCPICGKEVTKVIETDNEYKTDVKCESEYYIHYGNRLVKFKNPKHNYYDDKKV